VEKNDVLCYERPTLRTSRKDRQDRNPGRLCGRLANYPKEERIIPMKKVRDKGVGAWLESSRTARSGVGFKRREVLGGAKRRGTEDNKRVSGRFHAEWGKPSKGVNIQGRQEGVFFEGL